MQKQYQMPQMDFYGAQQGRQAFGMDLMQQGANNAPQMQQAYGASGIQTEHANGQQAYQPQMMQTGDFSMPVAPQVAQHTGTLHGRRANTYHRENERTQNCGMQDCKTERMAAGEQEIQARGESSGVLDVLARISSWQFAGRNVWLLVGAAVGAVWFAYMIVMLSHAVNVAGFDGGYELAVQELRAGISVFMQMPSILSGFVGMIFNWLAWAYNKKSLALTAAILYGAAVLLSFGQSLGYGAFVAVNLLGYFQLVRQKTKAAA